eukprot:TRINITY_DN14598_c0_g1_i4.p1 TRINITY_DN14598_c0_g1~~TRINITY_DN14598_c0_g1_i4.p1  ORF type:complete len:317 (+),score=17.08 TRINITY_DN14598_c0_g1_i4:516-1466(+)
MSTSWRRKGWCTMWLTASGWRSGCGMCTEGEFCWECRGSRPWRDINKKLYFCYEDIQIKYRLSRKAYFVNRELWVKLRELYGSRFIFKVTKDSKYQTYLEDKEHDAFPEDRNNFSQECDLPTEIDIVDPLISTESEMVFRRMNTSLSDTEDLLEKLKKKKQQRKVADIVKSDVEILSVIAREEGEDLCRKATCGIEKDCVAPVFGFKNYDVNCYINATLQCLLCIPEMNTYFLERQYKNSSMHRKESSFPVCDLIADLYDKAFSENTRNWIAPRSLVKICSSGQQDAHEFLWKLSLIHICRCRRYAVCRSRWSPYH